MARGEKWNMLDCRSGHEVVCSNLCVETHYPD